MRASLSRLATVGFLLALIACFKSEEKQVAPAPAAAERIEVLVPELVDAIQAKQPEFILDHLDESFKAEDGLDYFGVRSLVDSYAFRDEEVGARLESVSVTPESDGRQRVKARVSFALGGRLAESAPLPKGAVTYALDLIFELDGTRWQAVAGSYRRE